MPSLVTTIATLLLCTFTVVRASVPPAGEVEKLVQAAEDGDVGGFMGLATSENINALNKVKTSAIYAAAKEGRTSIIEHALTLGADVNIQGPTNLTVLQQAVQAGHLDATTLLLDAGADISAEGLGQFTALHFAAGKGYTEICKLLIARGANVNAKAVAGFTPIFLAINANMKDTFYYLATVPGIDLGAHNMLKKTALDLVVEKGWDLDPVTKSKEREL